MTLAIAVLAWLAVAVLATGRLHVLLHTLQQEHYENARLRLWIAKDRRRLALPEAAALAAGGAVVALLAASSQEAALIAAAVGYIAAVARARDTWRRPQVKPLVFTPRARRLFVLALVLTALAPALAGVLAGGSALAIGVLGALSWLASPWLLGLANTLLRPVQQLDTRRFVRSAQRRLAEVAPLVVGITGSYGKTTTKACVAAVLDASGPAYPTPASFNSYLGVVRAINEGLRREHKSFVVEMGAYREGDVAELCELVHPRIGVLTAIGPAHLERFGSLEVTERAKGELAAALPADGVFVTRADDERCRRVAAQRARSRVLLFSPAPHPDADVWAEDIVLKDGRTEFTLHTREANSAGAAVVRSQLLGEHNVANLLAAAAVGLVNGLTLAQMARVLGRVRPPQHRLSSIVNASAGIVVIDDSYNANPVGAAAALAVLRSHPAGRRILVTPGLVELGEQEREANREFGVLAAAACDLCVLSGTRAQDIRAGLLAAGFDDDQIVVTADGPSAHARIAELSRRGDVILFENDLPDVYA